MLYQGFLFGLTLQLAVGPVFFAVFNRGLQQGLAAALAMTWGVALADTIYIVVSFTGVSSLLMMPAVSRITSWLAAVILVLFGLSYFRPIRPLISGPAAPLLPVSLWDSFKLGLKMTLASPLTIVFWSCTFGALISSGILPHADILEYATGCILSTLVFLSAVSILIQPLSTLLKPHILRFLNHLVGVFLIGFACKVALGI